MRILFTGGSGKAGRHALPYLAERGHHVLNADLVPLDGFDHIEVDLTDAGQVHNVMASYANLDELGPGTGVPAFDAVVHFAAVPRILLKPDNETFRINTLSTYNVIDAGLRAGVRKIVFASSETTYGICFWDGEKRPDYIPVDEDHPTVPADSYAMSKVVNEATARSFQARSGADIYGLRINNVIEPHEYARDFPAYVAEPDLRRRNVFAYIDVRDLAQAVERCLHTDGLGYRVFNIANADTSVAIDTDHIRDRYYAGVPMKRAMGPHETFYAIDRARQLLDFEPRHSWRSEVGTPT